MQRLSAKTHIALGQSLLVVTLLLLAVFLQLVPDRVGALRESRAVLSEAVAISASTLVAQREFERLEEVLGLMVARNEALLSAAVRRAGGEAVVTAGEHRWEKRAGERSSDTQVRVPIWGADGKWGQVELRYAPLLGPGWLALAQHPVTKLIAFIGLAAFLVFYFYLARVLKHLDPSQAVPPHVRSALDTLAEGLMVVDLKDNVVLANQAFASLVGRTPNELVGHSASAFTWVNADGSPLPHSELPWRRTLREGAPQRNDMVHLRDAAGGRRTFIVNASPVLGDGKKHGGALVSLDDVTQLEAHKVQLRNAKDEAEAANRAKSEFLANMSHEIRTPMNAILGFTDILRRGYVTSAAEQAKHLATIRSSGEHLLQLINDILDLSKVESGRLEVERLDCAPHVLVRDVVNVLAVKAREKGISLELDADGPIPERVVSDPTRLRQIMTNLISNAVKFTDEGAVRVTMRLTGAAESPRLEIDVADNGIGIPEEKLDSIFEPFVQADTSVTRRYGGTGLGLAISRRFARLMGGDIVARSEAGRGSVFTVTLDPGPLEGVPMLEPAQALAASVAPAENADMRWVFPAARVLVVDDGEENRELLRLMLGEVGLAIEEAQNGQVGVDKARAGAFDVILMDMQMPVMDGYAATRALREAGLETPIIALTANAMKGFEEECLAAGCTGYLTKPVDIDRLTETLAEHLGGRRAQDEGREAPVPMPEPHAAAPRAEPASGPPVVSRLAGASPRIRATVAKFAARLDDKLAEMEASWERGDYDELAALAHWLKGSAGTVGYDAFTEPAKTLEGLAKARQSEAIGPALRELRSLAARVVVPDQEQESAVAS